MNRRTSITMLEPADACTPLVTLSIVSHGQGSLIDSLLSDLRHVGTDNLEVVLTLNVPEDEQFIERHGDLPLRVLRNSHRQGFGANHNAAFRVARGQFFAVVNPDIRLPRFDLRRLVETASGEDVGLCAPAVYDSEGRLQDSVRRYPTLQRLLVRQFAGRQPDYSVTGPPFDVDWVAGMFMLLPATVFDAVGGFDERYFMYFEDADLCQRLVQRGYRVRVDPAVEVIHDARRDSHRSARHLRWHLRSAVRFLWKV